MTYVFPTLVIPKHHFLIQFNLRKHTIRHMSVLIQSHRTSMLHRKIALFDIETVWISYNSVIENRIVIALFESDHETNSAIRLRRLTVGSNDRKPIVDEIARLDFLRRNSGDSDQICAEHIIVLDLKLDLRDWMSERDFEVLVPDRVLVVGDNASSSHSGAGEADRDVRVAGDDFVGAVAAELACAAGERVPAGIEGTETATEALGHQIHVR